MDVGDDAAAGDGRLDQGVELLVTADGELEVAGRDALDLWVSGSRGRRRRSERVVVGFSSRERNGQKKRFSNGFKHVSTVCRPEASATPNGNVPVSGAGGRRERRCRRNAP